MIRPRGEGTELIYAYNLTTDRVLVVRCPIDERCVFCGGDFALDNNHKHYVAVKAVEHEGGTVSLIGQSEQHNVSFRITFFDPVEVVEQPADEGKDDERENQNLRER